MSVHVVHSDGQKSTLVVLIDPMLVAMLVLANAILCISLLFLLWGEKEDSGTRITRAIQD